MHQYYSNNLLEHNRKTHLIPTYAPFSEGSFNAFDISQWLRMLQDTN